MTYFVVISECLVGSRSLQFAPIIKSNNQLSRSSSNFGFWTTTQTMINRTEIVIVVFFSEKEKLMSVATNINSRPIEAKSHWFWARIKKTEQKSEDNGNFECEKMLSSSKQVYNILFSYDFCSISIKYFSYPS